MERASSSTFSSSQLRLYWCLELDGGGGGAMGDALRWSSRRSLRLDLFLSERCESFDSARNMSLAIGALAG